MRFEHWVYSLPLKFRSLLRRGQVERELGDEMQFHLDQLIEEGVARGLSAEAARAAALRAMGGLTQHQEEARDMWGVRWFTDLVDDTRFAWRSLRRSPGLTLFVVSAIALGIGMTAAAFSMLDALVFRPYPVPHPAGVVTLVSTSRESAFEGFSHREYADIRTASKSFAGVVASTTVMGVGYGPDAKTSPRVKPAMLVSGNYFRVLGVEPRLGRGFRDDEDQAPGRDAVVVVSWSFWEREFACDSSVLGRTLRLNGRDFTVIGVAPESFPGMFIFARNDFYIPLAMARLFMANSQKDFFESRDDRGLTLRARLGAHTTLAQARRELEGVSAGFQRNFPPLYRDRGASVRTQMQMRTQANAQEWKFGLIFTVLALATLLVACTNVAGLLLSRARARTREIAVRLALGAGRERLVRFLMTESVILAVLGGIAGAAVGYVAIQLMGKFSIPTDLPITIPFRMDTRVLLACAALAMASAVLCGLAPALQSTRVDLITGLHAADVDPPGSGRLWGRNALVVAQVAMSLMLLTAAFLMARSFQRDVERATGFRKDHVLMARLDPRLLQYDATRTQQFYRLLAERLRAIPGVQSVGLTQNPPLSLDVFERLPFVPEDHELPQDRDHVSSAMDAVDEGFFETMGIAILRGRPFQASDDVRAPRVAIVNEHFANHYWPGRDAVGRRFRLEGRDGEPVEIVGVARTIPYGTTGEKPMDFVYLPVAQRPAARLVVLLHSPADPLALVEPVKAAVHSLDADLPILELRTYEDLYRYSAVEGPRVAVRLVGTLGAVAVLLAIAGLYGLVAYNVTCFAWCSARGSRSSASAR
jgi:predicted permease